MRDMLRFPGNRKGRIPGLFNYGWDEMGMTKRMAKLVPTKAAPRVRRANSMPGDVTLRRNRLMRQSSRRDFTDGHTSGLLAPR